MMRFAKLSRIFIPLIAVLVAFSPASAQTYSVLYSFQGAADGAIPTSPLILDSAGNLYGTTFDNGFGGRYGSLFEISTNGKFTLLHSFGPKGSFDPVSPLIRDSAGNLYGINGGGGSDPGGFGGAIYKLTPKKVLSVLFNFPSHDVGQGGGLIFDSAGNLYGAGGGGAQNCAFGSCGAIYKIAPNGTATVLHAFKDGAKGCYPASGLVTDAAGNLYGTTLGCGTPHNDGVVFKLDPSGNETVLHTFQGLPDGAAPNPGLIRDAEGNLYGSTVSGGNTGCTATPKGCGTIFKLDPNGNETVLYRFTGEADGGNPGSLVMDAEGNLYGPAGWSEGGKGFGVIFKLDPAGNETVLYHFVGGTSGKTPTSLTIDAEGNFYGTASGGGDPNGCTSGGASGCGVVFKLTP